MKRQQLIKDLTLMLMNLTSWETNENTRKKKGVARGPLVETWKGYDFDVLDALEDDGYIASSYRSKLATITKEGQLHATDLLGRYGIELDPDPEPQRFFRLLLRFDFVELVCVRNVLIPEHTTFEDFHTMMQACFNWLNYHLYHFSYQEKGAVHRISWPSYETGGDPYADWDSDASRLGEWHNSALVYLDDVLPRVKNLKYEYDYGDGWEIDISLLNEGEKLKRDTPICWDGSGDAPPEDVGGEGGFRRFLRVLEDPSDPEYGHLKSWGDSQGFEHFSKRRASERMERWQDWRHIEDEPIVSSASGATYGVGESDPELDYEQMVERNREDNERYLASFETSLVSSGLSRKTVNKHLSNVEFYLNDYLNYRDAATMQEGVHRVGGFLGDWFIRKCMWASKTSIRENAASLKKFYKIMAYKGLVSMDDYRALSDEVKQDMPEWLHTLEQWDDPNSDYWAEFEDVF